MAEADKKKIDRLERAGISIDALLPEQRRVLAELSDDEVNTLVRIRDRLRAPVQEAVGVFYY